MKKLNILYLEKRGCDFWKDDKSVQNSDVGNYRVGCYNNRIKAKDEVDYILEFTHGKKYQVRTTNKRTGKPLKKHIIETLGDNYLYIDNEYENEEGSFGNCKLLENFNLKNHNLQYTKKDILFFVNTISIIQYDDIVIM